MLISTLLQAMPVFKCKFIPAIHSNNTSLPHTFSFSDKPIPGSIGMNYDFATQKVINADITITNGIVCHNCYAFVGGQYQLNIQFLATSRSGKGFGFDARVFGGAGFNIDLQINNPSFATTITKQLVPASTDATTMITLPGQLHFVSAQHVG